MNSENTRTLTRPISRQTIIDLLETHLRNTKFVLDNEDLAGVDFGKAFPEPEVLVKFTMKEVEKNAPMAKKL